MPRFTNHAAPLFLGALLYCLIAIEAVSAKADQSYPETTDFRRCGTIHLLQQRVVPGSYQGMLGRGPGNVLSRPTQPGEAGRTGGFGHTYTTPVTSYDSPEGHFRIWYVTTGTDRPGSGHGVPSDQNSNGIPDWVEKCAEFFEASWTTTVDDMGFRPPVEDFTYNTEYLNLGLDNGGDGRYDVYILDIGASIAGYTGPEQVTSGRILPSYIVVDNDFAGVKSTLDEALELLKATAAHELFHATQFAYDVNEDIYWLEQSAVWMEEQVFDEVNDYYNYLSNFSGFLSEPWVSLDTRNGQHEFAGVLWPLFLSEEYGVGIIRSIWENAVTVQSLDAMEQVLTSRNSTLPEAFQEFTVWNAITGVRGNPALSYEEGAQFPVASSVDSFSIFPASGPNIPSSRFPSHLAANYLQFTPDPLRGGGLQFDFDGITGQWGVSILGISITGPDTVITVPISMTQSGVGVISDWDRYDLILLAVASLNLTGSNYQYQFTATYDSSLVNRVIPPTVSVTNGPNPLHANDPYAIFRYALSSSGRVDLYIYNVLGQEIFSLTDPILLAGFYEKRWYKTDRSGRRVPSGIYIYRFSFTDISGGNTTVTQKMVLIE